MITPPKRFANKQKLKCTNTIKESLLAKAKTVVNQFRIYEKAAVSRRKQVSSNTLPYLFLAASWNNGFHSWNWILQSLKLQTKHSCLKLQNTHWPACLIAAWNYTTHADLLEITEHMLTCLLHICLNLQNTHWPACLCSTSKYLSGVTMLRGCLNAHHMTERAPTDFQKLRKWF